MLMVMSVNFLVDALDLYNDPNAVNYAPWFDGGGTILSLIIPLVCSLFFVLVFYYLWARFKPLTTFHWLLTGFVNLLVGFVIVLFMSRASLANYIDVNLVQLDSTTFQPLWDSVVDWPYVLEIWMLAVNSIVWSFLFFFLLSWVLKRWSTYSSIPFGVTNKKVKKTKRA